MRDDYDFSNGIKNPYADKLKKQITIRLDDEVVNYFKNMAEETGMPYQNIINIEFNGTDFDYCVFIIRYW